MVLEISKEDAGYMYNLVEKIVKDPLHIQILL